MQTFSPGVKRPRPEADLMMTLSVRGAMLNIPRTPVGKVPSLRTEKNLCYIKNQQDATLAVLFISNCKITLHVSDTSRVHHQEY